MRGVEPAVRQERLQVQRRTGFWRSGEPYVWSTGAAVALSLLLVAGLIGLVAVRGLGHFWPADVARIVHDGGMVSIGEVVDRERVPLEPGSARAYRIQVKVGNRDLYGLDFRWIEAGRVEERTYPPEIAVIERREWGSAYGVPLRIEENGRVLAAGEELWPVLRARHAEALRLHEEARRLEKRDVGRINRRIETARLEIAALERSGGDATQAGARALAKWRSEIEAAEREYKAVLERVNALRARTDGAVLILATAEGAEHAVPLTAIVRAYRPNRMNALQKAGLYLTRLWEFVAGEPRESNTEGGIFPAIFGTVLMVLVMTIAVVPAGVLAAVYLREYAGDGVLVSALRIAIRNLAGVPSIVYGVFGMGFLIYTVGGGIDRLLFAERLPAPTFGTGGILWASLTLALLTLPVVIVATEEGLAAVPASVREASYALGATRFETVWKVAVPGALPGILTGMILGVARATGEVAPLMMTGVVKLAPELPVDAVWPFVHLERKFMHLGFYIYDLGFQSPNVEAARPMLFATALALLAVVVSLNLIGISLRNRLRAKSAGARG